MFAQLVQDFIHLERGQNRLDQDRGANRAVRNAQIVLRLDEHVVPQPRFEMALQLRQVEIGPAALVDQLAARCG